MARPGPRTPRLGEPAASDRIDGEHGRIVDHQPASPAKPERWLIRPRKRGVLSVWLTRDEFALTGEPRWWKK